MAFYIEGLYGLSIIDSSNWLFRGGLFLLHLGDGDWEVRHRFLCALHAACLGLRGRLGVRHSPRTAGGYRYHGLLAGQATRCGRFRRFFWMKNWTKSVDWLRCSVISAHHSDVYSCCGCHCLVFIAIVAQSLLSPSSSTIMLLYFYTVYLLSSFFHDLPD